MNKKIFFISLISTALLAGQASANLLVYDGFLAGGDNPDTSAGEYQSEPGSTDGTDNDSIMGQGPNTIGFTDSWVGASGAPGNMNVGSYPRINNTGLNYTDGNGLSLVTQDGAVEIFRSSEFTSARSISRNLSGVTTSSDGFWMSTLIQFSEGSGGRLGFETSVGGSSGRFHEIGFTVDGNLVVGSDSTGLNISQTTYAANTTHFIVANFKSGAFGDRFIDVWMNPNDLTNLGTPDFEDLAGDQATTTTQGDQIRIQTEDTFEGFSFIVDEIRIGDAMEDVLVPIPEPGTYAAIFGFLALGIVFWVRRRK
ncbi:MAG: hypothetical protein LAT55_02190 [Opitutales bacterium]|nr:hypothetical protein [Opitutales bacterium]